MTVAAQASVDELARRCTDETAKFQQQQHSDPQYCFELLRRALMDEGSDALTYVFEVYKRQVLRWVQSHSGFAHTNESADFFAHAALSNFYFALRGERFARFPSLQHALAYLKACVHTAIVQFLRDQGQSATLSLADVQVAVSEATSDSVSATEVWTRICALLPNQHDQQLARYVFLLDMKPRQIVALPGHPWQSTRDVTVRLYQIRVALRRDEALRDLLGSTGRADELGG